MLSGVYTKKQKAENVNVRRMVTVIKQYVSQYLYNNGRILLQLRIAAVMRSNFFRSSFFSKIILNNLIGSLQHIPLLPSNIIL